MKFIRKTTLSSEIPTASMPDLIFMLLIFFMVTTVLREYSGLPIELPKAKRIEVRFPDCGANSYLAFAAMMMAGLDGIKNKIDPGNPREENLYDLPEEELNKLPQVCGSLREALNALNADRDFLKDGGVFDDDLIDAYINLRMEDVVKLEHTPCPVEYEMYYSI